MYNFIVGGTGTSGGHFISMCIGMCIRTRGHVWMCIGEHCMICRLFVYWIYIGCVLVSLGRYAHVLGAFFIGVWSACVLGYLHVFHNSSAHKEIKSGSHYAILWSHYAKYVGEPLRHFEEPLRRFYSWYTACVLYKYKREPLRQKVWELTNLGSH